MMGTTFGDMSKRLALQRQGSGLKQAVRNLSQEMTTGIVRDKSNRVNGEFSKLAGIKGAIGMASARKASAQFAGTIFSMQQSILADLGKHAQNGFLDQTIHSPIMSSAEISRSIGVMESTFQNAVSQLNTELGGRTLFAGTTGDSAALIGADAILAEISDSLIAAYPAGPDVEEASAFIANWFSDSGQYATLAYRGGPPIPARLDLGHGITVGFEITAQDSDIREFLGALALGAVLSKGLFEADQGRQHAMLQNASLGLGKAQTGLIALSANLGIQEERAREGQVRAEAEYTAMSIARAELLEADPYDTAIRLEQTMTQLDLIYNLTARLSRLSLASYLR